MGNLIDFSLGLVGGVSIMLAGAWFLSGKFADHLLKKSREREKQDRDAENAKQLEQIKNELRAASDSQLEKVKAELARGIAVTTARIEQLRTLWEATHSYAGAISMAVHGTDNHDEVYERIENFKKAVSKTGVFIGHTRYESILQRIGDPFLLKLANADAVEKTRLYNEFQHKLLLETLSEIEGLLVGD